MTTVSDKGLKPGMWCTFSGASEWKVLHNATKHVDVGLRVVVPENGDACFVTPEAVPHRDPANRVLWAEFAVRAYEQAEIDKKAKEEEKTIWTDYPYLKDDHEKRIKALEERMEKIEHYAGITALKRKATYGKLMVVEERVSELEKAKNEMDEAIVGLMAKEREYEYLTGPIQPAKDHWPLIGYRKEESPKNLPFEVALVYAKNGRKIKRRAWLNSLLLSEGRLCWSDEFDGHIPFFDSFPILATDWEVLSDLP